MRWLVVMLLAVSAPALAEQWRFGEPVAVTQAHGARVFHHLDAAGRNHIAVSDKTVAVTWEDNRTGEPQVYVAFKTKGDAGFSRELQLSRGKAAYEPVVASLPNGRFVLAWEEAGRVWLQLASKSGRIGEPVNVGEGTRQASIASRGASAWVAWSRQTAGGKRIEAARITFGQDQLSLGPPQAIEPHGKGDQSYPSLAITDDRTIIVAWEDRRAGHTRIHYATSHDGVKFSASTPLNAVRRSQTEYGRGPGAARVALAPYQKGVASVWLDKRDFRSGYDVYAAIAEDKAGRFGANEKVQDSFGDTFSQWHAAVAATDSVVVAWDDDRDETADVFLSRREPASWSDNVSVPGASGPGDQREQAIAADADGSFHLVWVEQPPTETGTRIRYLQFAPR